MQPCHVSNVIKLWGAPMAMTGLAALGGGELPLIRRDHYGEDDTTNSG